MKKRTKIVLGSAAGLLVIGALASTGDEETPATAGTSTSQAAPSAEKAEPEQKGKAEEKTKTETKTKTEKKTEKKSEMTVAQEQAVRAAQSYVDNMPFSRQGLIDQLTSEYGNGFEKADAEFAVKHINVDWNAEAVEAAESYLETVGGFSRQGLIDQLTSEYGSQFTVEQATYAVDKVGF